MFQQTRKFTYLNITPQEAPAFIPSNCKPSDFEFCFKEYDSIEEWKKQREKDYHFINTFLLNTRINKTGQPKNSLKIFEGKQLLIDIIQLKKELQSRAFNLDINDETFDEQWESVKMKMSNINDKITNLQFNIIGLKKKICKRSKNRKARKKKRDKEKVIKKEKINETKIRHKIIDQLLSEKSEEVSDAKREIALKNQADAVLHEVRKKKYEAKKMLKMLSALSQLRELRVKQEEERGGYCSKQLTETFNKVVRRFQLLWEKQSEIYKLEEKGLKMMLGENALPLVKESKFETNLLQWKEVLFGNISTDSKEKLLTAADNNLEALIHIRSDWDKFMTKEATLMSSSMPPGWILPPETNDEDWKKFIIEKKIFHC